MANLSLVRARIEFLATLPPRVIVRLSNAHVELMVADTAKSIAEAITNKALSRQVLELSKGMAKQAGVCLAAAWEPGDELCPPWPFVIAEAAPHPWKTILAAEQVELAHNLTMLAGLTASEEFNVALKRLATKLAVLAAAAIGAEFERCATVPRKPFPCRR